NGQGSLYLLHPGDRSLFCCLWKSEPPQGLRDSGPAPCWKSLLTRALIPLLSFCLLLAGPLLDQSPVIIQDNRTWFEALSACHARGQILAGRVVLQPGLKAWLGLHRHGLWGYWVWANGSAVEEPQSWREGEPSDPLWGNCGAGTGTEEGVLWEDECCEQELYYVCE
uniref:C-type lectin domain-containing protein n=1 Tax=Podarcis muralis TaxID=64176 RepID=A0A670HWE3_PODMU